MAQSRVDVDPFVGQQPVHLFDRVFGDQPACQGKTLSDRINRQGCGSEDAESCVGQGQYAFGVEVAVKQAVQKAMHFLGAKGLVRFHRSPRELSCTGGDSRFEGFRQPIYDRRKFTNPDNHVRILFGKIQRPF